MAGEPLTHMLTLSHIELLILGVVEFLFLEIPLFGVIRAMGVLTHLDTDGHVIIVVVEVRNVDDPVVILSKEGVGFSEEISIEF